MLKGYTAINERITGFFMKILAQYIENNPVYTRVFEWGKLVTVTGSAQVVIQALGLVGGILILRLLPTSEYALYTLANTMAGTMLILADGGLATGVLSLGGKVWQDPEKLGVVIITGLKLRKIFAFFSVVVATPILFYLLKTHGASWLMATLISASLIPGFIAGLTGELFSIPSSLFQDIKPLQMNQVKASVARLLLTLLTLFFFPWAYIAVLAAGLPQIWVNKKLRIISNNYADLKQNPDNAIRSEMLMFVKRILPHSVYYSLSGQMTIWLVSTLGSSTGIAQAGALGRLMMVLNVFSMLFSSLITPRFARTSIKSKILVRRFISIQVGLLLFSISIVLITYSFPSQILWILGKNYSGLQKELLLSVFSSCIGLTSGLTYSLIASRGWIINPAIGIPINIIFTVGAVYVMDLSSLEGVLKLSIFVGTVQLIMNTTYGWLKSASTQFAT